MDRAREGPLNAADLRNIRTTVLQMTQAALADALGVRLNTVSRWERGAIAIQHPRVLELALERLAETRRAVA